VTKNSGDVVARLLLMIRRGSPFLWAPGRRPVHQHYVLKIHADSPSSKRSSVLRDLKVLLSKVAAAGTPPSGWGFECGADGGDLWDPKQRRARCFHPRPGAFERLENGLAICSREGERPGHYTFWITRPTNVAKNGLRIDFLMGRLHVKRSRTSGSTKSPAKREALRPHLPSRRVRIMSFRCEFNLNGGAALVMAQGSRNLSTRGLRLRLRALLGGSRNRVSPKHPPCLRRVPADFIAFDEAGGQTVGNAAT